MKQQQPHLEHSAATSADSDAPTQEALLESTLDLSTASSGDYNARQKKPALIELVLQTLGRSDLFDAASFKALRLTCKKLRDLVETIRFKTFCPFDLYNPGRIEALEAWTYGGRLVQRTTSLSLYGYMPPELADRVSKLLKTQPIPSLKDLTLSFVGAVGEQVLLAAPLKLMSLNIYSNQESRILHTIASNTAYAGINNLALMIQDSVPAADLGAALAHLKAIRCLVISNMCVIGPLVHHKALENSLKRLNSLIVINCRGIEKIGLMGAGGPSLPALSSLSISKMSSMGRKNRPWLRQLTKLTLNSVQDSSAIVPALNGGPLKELSISLEGIHPARAVWDWAQVDLPQLTSLRLSHYPGDVFGAAASAKMPQLRCAQLSIGTETHESSVLSIIAAFPQLCELTLYGSGSGPPPRATVEALSLELVPNLKGFAWKAIENDIDTIQEVFLPRWLGVGAPRWPQLRSLILELAPASTAPCQQQMDFLTSLARSAPHCPGLTSLCVGTGATTSEAAVDAFVAAAKVSKAWNRLKDLRVSSAKADNALVRQKLRDAWPAAMMG